jgi:hypothetical protein
VHFIKLPYPGKPVWQPAYGLFIVGCLLGFAYVIGGRSLWLPVVIHATMVFLIEVMKIYAVYRAPPWLMGYAEGQASGRHVKMLLYPGVRTDDAGKRPSRLHHDTSTGF